ncbi:cellobiose transport system permease protein [Streptomonospora salina]|uniref:Cellobiose transport system permease protein n=2 Tax=Streptomonospora salina TaxID=104205 RepID=A0A841EC26_9ACTN|nr:sugar ABC transporter permease [Streptomonospora salina]MBB6000536.1 cellobiose transport system permease protein [Streptomonospora salina]
MTSLQHGAPPSPAPGSAGGAGDRPPDSRDRARARRSQMWSRLDIRTSPYLFITPFFLLFGIFGLFPLLYTVWVSLHDWSLIGGNEGFVGLDNFVRLAGDEKFWSALYNTLGIFTIAVVPQLLLALMLADTLNRRIRFANLFRMTLVLPYITSVAALAIVFSVVFGGEQFGLINQVLGSIGLDPISWQGDRYWSWAAIATMIDWRWTGYNALIYLAAMQSVPKDVYEAADLDGASRARQFVQITVPLLRPTIIFTVIISTIGQMQLFTEPTIFGNNGYAGGTQGQFQTVMMLVFQETFDYQNFGYAAAISWVLFLIVVVMGLINVWLTSRIKGAE